MKKEEIVKAIAKNLQDVNGKKFRKDDVQNIINYFVNLTKKSLRDRDKVVIRGFGTFAVKRKKAKEIICVRTGERIKTSDKDCVVFIPSDDFNLDTLD